MKLKATSTIREANHYRKREKIKIAVQTKETIKIQVGIVNKLSLPQLDIYIVPKWYSAVQATNTEGAL